MNSSWKYGQAGGASYGAVIPPVGPGGHGLDRADSEDSSSDGFSFPCPAEPGFVVGSEPQQQGRDYHADADARLEQVCLLSEFQAGYPGEEVDEIDELLELDCPLSSVNAMLRQAGVPVTADQDACAPATAGLIAANGLAPLGAPLTPVVPADSSCQPGEALCSSCTGSKAQADELATACLAGRNKPENKQLASCLLLKSVLQCQCSSSSSSGGCARPGLYKRHDELASSAGQVWAVTDAQPRRAEKGLKRGTGAYAWNVNWTAASPLLLPDQEGALQLLLSGSSSSSSSSASSSASSPAPTLYSMRAADGPVVAYGVALTGQPPSSLGGESMWSPINCNKAKNAGHALHGKQLYLFRYAVAVYNREKAVKNREKAVKSREKSVKKSKKA